MCSKDRQLEGSTDATGCIQDIPIGLYSYSFMLKDFGSHWPGQQQILNYMHEVVEKFELRSEYRLKFRESAI